MTRNDLLLWILSAVLGMALGMGFAFLLSACTVDAIIIKVDDSNGKVAELADAADLTSITTTGYLRSRPALAETLAMRGDKAYRGQEGQGQAKDNTLIKGVTGRYEAPGRLYGDSVGGLEGDSDILWENRAIFPDGQTILLSEPEFAVTFWSVMQQESTFRPEAQNWATIDGVTYEVAGCMQLLLDPGMLGLIAEMGYTRAEMYDCPKNVLVAQEYWRRDMERTGRPWRLWVARPQYRADGQSGEY